MPLKEKPHRDQTVRSEAEVHGYVTRTCFKTGPPGRVGLESEWFVHDAVDARRHVPFLRLQDLADASRPLPGGSALTFEPGGQLELSTACADDVARAQELLEGDLRHLGKLVRDAGLRLVGVGVDPVRTPMRLLADPRYVAMESYFAPDGPAGATMMTSTASVQVCLDAGADAADVQRRWALTNDLTPVLVAAFANSPLHLGRPTGLRCTRQDVWSRIDPTRTSRPASGDPAQAWARYALDARVLLVRAADRPWVARPGMTLRDWVSGTTPYGRPTYGDLAYHLTTLFPPVRPHGWLELRMMDALPDRLWPVAAAVAVALVDDPRAADTAREVVDSTRGLEAVAARDAVGDPRLRGAARRCFRAALEALPRVGAGHALVDLVGRYADRYVEAGRTPGDDLLDDLRQGRTTSHRTEQLA